MHSNRDFSLQSSSVRRFKTYGQERVFLKQLNTKLMEKAVCALQKTMVRSVKSIQPYFSVCSALPSEYISASCHGSQKKSANFALHEILRPETSITGESIPSPTTNPTNLDVTYASVPFLLILSLPRRALKFFCTTPP